MKIIPEFSMETMKAGISCTAVAQTKKTQIPVFTMAN